MSAWYDRLVERFGQPRLSFDTAHPGGGKKPRMINGEHGHHHRRGYCWFPVMDGRPVNHNVHVDTYGGTRVNVEAGSHTRAGGVYGVSIWADTVDPDQVDRLMEEAVRLTFSRAADHERL